MKNTSNSKIFKHPKSRENSRLTPFDMSHTFKFTANAGHIIPVECDILNPGEKARISFKFGAKNLQPFQQAAMCTIDFHVDYFFVPMFMLRSNFDNFIFQTQENYSSVFQPGFGSDGLVVAQNMSMPTLSSASIRDALEGYTYNDNEADTLPSHSSQQDVYSTTPLGGGLRGVIDLYSFYPESYLFRVNRLFDYLGLNFDVNRQYIPSFFPYQILAYNAIYQHYFRLDEYEKFDSNAYNWDTMQSGTSNQYTWCQRFLGIQYCQKYHDYFTSRFRSPLANDLNAGYSFLNENQYSRTDLNATRENYPLSSDNGFNPSFGTGEYGDLIDTGEQFLVSDGLWTSDNYNNENYSQDPNVSAPSSINQLRLLFANEKLVALTNRSRKTYDAQVLAHFGIDVPHDTKHELSHLGHYKATLSVDEITALAGTETTPFGEWGSKGQVAGSSKPVNFTAPCHGVLMATFRIVPRYDYIVPLLKRNIVANRFDFFFKEFDDLGMQPLMGYELMPMSADGSTVPNVATEGSFTTQGLRLPVYNEYFVDYSYNATSPNGWQYRYSQFKSGIDRATHAFMPRDYSNSTGSNLSSWIVSKDSWATQYITTCMDDLDTPAWYLNYRRTQLPWLVVPQDLNGIFVMSYQGFEPSGEQWGTQKPYNMYARDQFIVNGFVDYQKLSHMSTYSLPRLGTI